MGTCCHCGVPTYSGDYCDPCNTDSCLVVDDNGDTHCRFVWSPDEED